MSYQYKAMAVMLNGNQKKHGNLSQQLTDMINENATDGWEFQGIDSSNIKTEPGCLGRLLGQSSVAL